MNFSGERIMGIAYVFSDGNTASTDYFLIPYLQSIGYVPKLIDTRLAPSFIQSSVEQSLVVISRYFPIAWRHVLASCKKAGSKIVYFMDDDLLDPLVLKGMPWRYRWKILKLAIGQKWRLREICNEFWVSTPYLMQKYAELKPQLIHAAPTPQLISSSLPLVKICYHATASHRLELLWLGEVMERVQACATNTHFELFGDASVKRYYRGIPRVSILHAMTWSQYLAWSGAVQRDIGLAPLLPNAFNHARGPTKFFDYARMGAAGIYTDVPPYQGFIRHGVDGLLVENNSEQWVSAILEFVKGETRRRNIANSARERALGMAVADDRTVSLVSSPTVI